MFSLNVDVTALTYQTLPSPQNCKYFQAMALQRSSSPTPTVETFPQEELESTSREYRNFVKNFEKPEDLMKIMTVRGVGRTRLPGIISGNLRLRQTLMGRNRPQLIFPTSPSSIRCSEIGTRTESRVLIRDRRADVAEVEDSYLKPGRAMVVVPQVREEPIPKGVAVEEGMTVPDVFANIPDTFITTKLFFQDMALQRSSSPTRNVETFSKEELESTSREYRNFVKNFEKPEDLTKIMTVRGVGRMHLPGIISGNLRLRRTLMGRHRPQE
ncbi:hypothetical protein Zmor_018458 [Zophobas morio]|uniref:Uncharacterized protein n=1 Tax=Zophobas morio TaxID=2755281 RepID=A0AA38IA82_9CUCU|nr:hypothetical protein Zmor_018458 [Zophobas morio]